MRQRSRAGNSRCSGIAPWLEPDGLKAAATPENPPHDDQHQDDRDQEPDIARDYEKHRYSFQVDYEEFFPSRNRSKPTANADSVFDLDSHCHNPTVHSSREAGASRLVRR